MKLGEYRIIMKIYIDKLHDKLNETFKYYEDDDAFSLTILKNGKVIHKINRGQLKNGKFVDENTKFNIGSISKMFLVIVILKMVDLEIVHLDVPIVKYIPKFEMKDIRYSNITVRMLLNHTAGLSGASILNYSGYSYNDIKNDFLKSLKNQKLRYKPGKIGIYCDDGFFLAQLLVEKLLKKIF